MTELFNNRILIIDDNESIHMDFKKALILDTNEQEREMAELERSLSGQQSQMLQTPEFKIDSAYQGQSGVQCIQNAIKNGVPYALAFVDIRMPPGWDGVETIEQIWKVDPNIQTVICTAYSDYSWEELYERIGHDDRLLLLKKPFDLVEIRLCALTLTKKWTLNQQANLKQQELQILVEEKTKELELSLALTNATLESTAEGIIAIDKNNNIINYNKKFMEMWNIPKFFLNQKKIKKISELMEAQLTKHMPLLVDVNKIILEKIYGNFSELQLEVDQSKKYFEQFIQPQYHHDSIVGMVYSFRDVTAHKNLEDELLKQATYDHLTGLPNRTLLLDRLQQAILYAKRTSMFIAVLFIDLDSFKYVNDSLGHNIGDELLKEFSQRLKISLRETDSIFRLNNSIGIDTAARLGGDEFVILLTMSASNNDHTTIAIQRLFEQLIPSYHLADHDLTLTLSMGVSVFPKDGEDPLTLIKNADSAMYHAKEKGKGTFEFYKKEMSEKSLKRLQLENDLRHAFKHNEFFINYQPLIDLSTKRLISFEALIRWKHVKHGLIPPTEFISVAEASGLIIPIGTWILKSACLQNKAWQESGLPKISIAVNISGYQFKQSNFVELVKNILKETNLEGKYLGLELTENSLLGDVKEASIKFRQLKEMGISIYIDDFGTGYSSLSYINQFSIDKLKIDQSFIKNLSDKEETHTIVHAVAMIARSFNMKVVAEGVETASQLKILTKLAIDEVQGYYLSRPMSSEETSQLLIDGWKWPIDKI